MSDTTTTTPAVEAPQTARASTDPPDTTPEATDTPDLGDGGKKALEAERRARRQGARRLFWLAPLAIVCVGLSVAGSALWLPIEVRPRIL